MAAKSDNQDDGKMIKLIWDSAEEIPALYANHLYISHGNQFEFYLIFGHLSPPMGFTPEEMPDEIRIKPIAQIVVSPENMRSFVDAMSVNLEKYEKRFEEKE